MARLSKTVLAPKQWHVGGHWLFVERGRGSVGSAGGVWVPDFV